MAEICRLCKIPVVIPGLDAVRCPCCGWVESLDRLAELQRQASRPERREAPKGGDVNLEIVPSAWLDWQSPYDDN